VDRPAAGRGLSRNTAPHWLLRDRDNIYDDTLRRRIASLGITDIISSPVSPWQNPYVVRVIGSIRRECLDHAIVVNQRHLRRFLHAYLAYCHRSRTHLSLGKDTGSQAGLCRLGADHGDVRSRRSRRESAILEINGRLAGDMPRRTDRILANDRLCSLKRLFAYCGDTSAQPVDETGPSCRRTRLATLEDRRIAIEGKSDRHAFDK
jgi:Integrase core domain